MFSPSLLWILFLFLNIVWFSLWSLSLISRFFMKSHSLSRLNTSAHSLTLPWFQHLHRTLIHLELVLVWRDSNHLFRFANFPNTFAESVHPSLTAVKHPLDRYPQFLCIHCGLLIDVQNCYNDHFLSPVPWVWLPSSSQVLPHNFSKFL